VNTIPQPSSGAITGRQFEFQLVSPPQPSSRDTSSSDSSPVLNNSPLNPPNSSDDNQQFLEIDFKDDRLEALITELRSKHIPLALKFQICVKE